MDDQSEQNDFKLKEFPHYDIIFKYQNPGKMKKIKNIDTKILKCFLTDKDNDQTIQLSFPRQWLSIDNLSIIQIIKKILNILNDYIHSQYDQDHIQQIFQQSFQDSHNINLNYPTDPDFINTIYQDIITVDQQLINKYHPYCGICQESFKINDSVIKLPCKSNEKDNPHFFHTGINTDICPGIKPWLKNNNSCPVCRFQLPYQKKNKSTPKSDSDCNSESELESELESESEIESQPQENIQIDPIVQQLTFERETINEQEIIIIFTIIDKIYQRYQPCQNSQCDLPMCIEDRERKRIDQQEEILLDEAIRMSLIQNDDTYLDNQLIEEQQKLFQQADQDYIDQIIQMSIVDQSQNPFLNLKNEQESSSEDGGNISPQSESQNIENVLMSQEDQQQKFDKYTQDEKEIVGQIEKINQNLDQLNENDSQNIIPCESDGEWSD